MPRFMVHCVDSKR